MLAKEKMLQEKIRMKLFSCRCNERRRNKRRDTTKAK